MIEFSSTAEHGRHMQPKGAFVETLKNFRGNLIENYYKKFKETAKIKQAQWRLKIFSLTVAIENSYSCEYFQGQQLDLITVFSTWKQVKFNSFTSIKQVLSNQSYYLIALRLK